VQEGSCRKEEKSEESCQEGRKVKEGTGRKVQEGRCRKEGTGRKEGREGGRKEGRKVELGQH
jgi:hypothetical protein